MKRILNIIMKHPKTAIAAAFAIAVLFVSCLSPAGQEKFNKFVKAAAPLLVTASQFAELTGHAPPGSTVAIQDGMAVITSPGSTEAKVMSIKRLGLEQAMKEGLIKEGERVKVEATADAAGNAVVQLIKLANGEQPSTDPKPVYSTQPPEPQHAPGDGVPPIIIAPELPPNPLLPKP